MAIKVAINGFGRIGRLAFRRIQDVEGLEVVAVNDLTDDDMLAHLLKYDTMQGRFTGEVEVIEGGFRVNGKEIKSFDEPDAGKLPWGDLDIDV
ncbi:type I glyceraldehyde-3-phosphate dehydrogenase, partial [Staphylococcus epidermidis]|nr:type I glyceraldehyde-3-phosphate dehydrogenase [Staphylococcus epidermidis]